VTGFAELGLSQGVLEAIEALEYTEPMPIQVETIPVIMRGRDIIGQAQTGSGKTAAFGLPAVEQIDETSEDIQVLVLTPTRELCIQVAQSSAASRSPSRRCSCDRAPRSWSARPAA
jgi:ATP-dependent RNA helicase DeaD